MDAQIRSHCNSGAEEKDGVEHVKDDHDDWVDYEALLERCRDEIE